MDKDPDMEPFNPGEDDGHAMERLTALTLRRLHVPLDQDEIVQAILSDRTYRESLKPPTKKPTFMDLSISNREMDQAQSHLAAALEAELLQDRLEATTAPAVSGSNEVRKPPRI